MYISNTQRYDTTRQRSHFARGWLDFGGADTAFLGRSTDYNLHLRKLSAPSETAYLSHSWSIARKANNGADSGAQTPGGRGVSFGNGCGTHSHLQKAPKTRFCSKKEGRK